MSGLLKVTIEDVARPAPASLPLVVGVDPGITGGIALLDGDDAHVWSMPTRKVKREGGYRTVIDEDALAHLLGDVVLAKFVEPEDAVAFVERAQASQQMGVSSAFNYGTGYGLVLGVLAHLRVPRRLVTPVTWKRGMGLVRPGNRMLGRNEARDKAPALDKARALYPQLADELARAKDDGRAEALLLAHWGAELLEDELAAGPLFKKPRKPATPAPLPEIDF